MDVLQLSVAELERKAGLRTNAVRNILHGYSKKPSAETLQAIADILGCTIKDLLGEQGHTELQKRSSIEKEEYNSPIEHPELFSSVVDLFLQICNRYEFSPTLKQAYFMVCEIYLFSLQRNMKTPDETFAEWLVKNNL